MSGRKDIRLSDLPHDHPLRNTPLGALGAEYASSGRKSRKRVTAHYRIARNTFNELGPAWTTHTEWFVVGEQSQ
jgi:hypothetical protein